jgi:hypothetical protein
MYRTLGPHWSGTLLGLVAVAIIPIPLVFYKYGHKIRRRSTLITSMQKDKARQDRKRAKADAATPGSAADPIAPIPENALRSYSLDN